MLGKLVCGEGKSSVKQKRKTVRFSSGNIRYLAYSGTLKKLSKNSKGCRMMSKPVDDYCQEKFLCYNVLESGFWLIIYLLYPVYFKVFLL